MYRILPTVKHGDWEEHPEFNPKWISDFDDKAQDLVVSPEQLRWQARKIKEVMFPEGIRTMMGIGSPGLKNGIGISTYSFTKSMSSQKLTMCSADGDLLIVPQLGALRVTTEFGKILAGPKEIVVIPRGAKFSVDPD